MSEGIVSARSESVTTSRATNTQPIPQPRRHFFFSSQATAGLSVPTRNSATTRTRTTGASCTAIQAAARALAVSSSPFGVGSKRMSEALTGVSDGRFGMNPRAGSAGFVSGSAG
jgi:hypothetical protein